MTRSLFEMGVRDEGDSGSRGPLSGVPLSGVPLGGVPRLRTPQRRQVEMRWLSLDEMLEGDHRARLVWQAVSGLDLSHWLRNIEAVEGLPGRNATDPRLLVAVWVYATLDGVGSARRLARLCSEQDGQLGYRWLCGGVTINHHTLSDFRSQHGEAWDELVTQIVASLMHEGLVTMKQVAQDGMRVQADAGKSSFRRRETLEARLTEARAQLEALKQLRGYPRTRFDTLARSASEGNSKH